MLLELIDAFVKGGSGETVLHGASVSVAPGERVALLGGNGSGKSTVLRALAMLLPLGSGSLRIDGQCIEGECAMRSARSRVGIVFQDPLDQIVSTRVFDEVAFGPRNLGIDEAEVSRRVEGALRSVGLSGFESRDTGELSGGEQQRLALAAVLSMSPEYLLLDEVTSMVDGGQRARIRSLVRKLVREDGLGVIQVTHDPLEALSADRVLIIEEGAVAWEGTPSMLLDGGAERAASVLWMGPYGDFLVEARSAGYDISRGLEPRDLSAWDASAVLRIIGARSGTHRDSGLTDDDDGPLGRNSDEEEGLSGNAGLVAERIGYSRGGEAVLRGVSLESRAGEVTLVAGPSGAGKSTLALVLAGLVEPGEGTVLLSGEPPRPGSVGIAFQRPENQFFLETVGDEIAYAAKNRIPVPEQVEQGVRAAARSQGIGDALLERDPFGLSGGQARRVALASIVSARPGALILDEPTAGLDVEGRRILHGSVRSWAREGASVLVVSHDLDEWLEFADRVVLLNQGRVAWQGTAEEASRDAGVYAAAGLEPPLMLQLRGYAEGGAAAGREEDAGTRTATHGTADGRRLIYRLDARVKLVLLMASVIAVLAAGSPGAIAIWALLLCLVASSAGVGPARVLRQLRPVALVLVFILCANLVSCDGTAPLHLAGPMGLDAARAGRALVAIARIVLMVMLSLMVTVTTDATDVADACVRLARPLGRLGLPVDDTGLVLSLALRFIPVVSEEIERVRGAQRARGADFEGGGLIARIRVWLTVLVPVVVGLFRRADAIGLSMEARCYAYAARPSPAPRPLGGTDRRVLVVGLAIIVAMAIGGLI